MNSASTISQVWLLVSALVTAAAVITLVVAGVRRCWWAALSDTDPLWRASGLFTGLALLLLAVVGAEAFWSTRVVPHAGWITIGAVAAALLLWAASMWTDRAPSDALVPGRSGTRPHRTAWWLGVWLVLASWSVLTWVPPRMAGTAVPSATHLLVVWAVVVAGGAVLLLGLRVVLRRGKTA